MNPKALSDQQLYAMVMDQSLPEKVKAVVNEEFKLRGFTQAVIDQLAVTYEHQQQQDLHSDVGWGEKLFIVLFPFFTLIHAIVANRHIKQGAPHRWRKHWNLLTLGYLLWTLFIFLFAKYFIVGK